MADRSTLDPENFPARRKRKTLKGHDVKALGPSDSSDTGSDMAGPGLVGEDVLRLGRGTNQDSEMGQDNVADAGPSVGDLGMDDTSDRSGTGEHLTAGKEPRVRVNADRDADRVVGPVEAGLGGGLDQVEEARAGKTGKETTKK
ncbi:MAG TPA: hypothetical protein VFZ81_04210 [Burkholderiales bacterium]